MLQLESVKELQKYVSVNRKAGERIAFVPTMGALHEGHLTLVKRGLEEASICIPYIFLNPTQFAPTEDLAKYPKTLQADLEKLESVGASAVYLPSVEDVYPNGQEITHTVKGISEPLEGQFRPQMFGGVATVLAKMFRDADPDVSLFGEKDYQQLLVIKQLVKDLKLPMQVIGVPTVRDENGLAMSSRNTYLTPAQYQIAIQLNKTLYEMEARYHEGQLITTIEDIAAQRLRSEGFESVDYIVIRDAETLLPPTSKDRPLRALAAARLGHTRLIDNIPIIP